MKRSTRSSPGILGSSSLLVSFALLMLAVLAMLCLSTALAQQRMAEASYQAVSDYYAADLEAEAIFARLRQGEQVPAVTEADGLYTYTVPISRDQTLYVTLERSHSGWRVLRWQAAAHPEQLQQTLPVWNGE